MTEILHIRAIWDAIFDGPLSSNFFAMLRAHTLIFTDKLVAEIKPLAVAAMGAEQFARMKEDIAQKSSIAFLISSTILMSTLKRHWTWKTLLRQKCKNYLLQNLKESSTPHLKKMKFN